MTDAAVTPNPGFIFRPMPGHNPRAKADRYRRVHFYTSELANAATGQLRQALAVLKEAAPDLPMEELQQAAGKEFSDSEYRSAFKELVCMWIHLEAVDQGGESMPAWLMNYLKLALMATDYIVTEPKAMDIMQKHGACEDIETLINEVSLTIGNYLGFAESAEMLSTAFIPLLVNSRSTRQKILKDSLTLDLGDYEL